MVGTMERTEVQSHGFSWEKEILALFGATHDDMTKITYTSKDDLPAEYNRIGPFGVSVKTSGSANAVCMGDCLRVYDAVSSGRPIHLVVIIYKQDDSTMTKKLSRIVEIDLTDAREALFGTLTRSQIEELDRTIKAVPQKRKPTPEEHAHMYSIRDRLQPLSGAIHLDIKCNSTQSRLQCSFNRFQTFIESCASRLIEKSDTNAFRGGAITSEIKSGRRVFKKSETV